MDADKTVETPDTAKQSLTITEAYNQAVNRLNAGNHKAAENYCNAILTIDPDNFQVLNLLGAIAQAAARHDRAIELFEQAIAVDANQALLHFNRSISLNHIGRRNEAIAALQAATQIEPHNRKIKESLSVLMQQAASPGKAAACTDIAKTLKRGIAAHRAGRIQEAEQYYRACLAKNPDHLDALNNLGTICMARNQGEAAIAHLEKAVAIKPDFADALNNLGFVLSQQNRLPEAVQYLEKAVAVKADFADALNNLGSVLLRQGYLKRAITCCRRAIEIKPRFAKAYGNLGYALIKIGDYPQAITTLKEAIAIKPDFAGAHNNLGNAYMEYGLLEAAIESCNKAIELQADFAEGYNNLGLAQKKLGLLDEARQSFEKGAEIKPDYAEIHSNLGNILKDQGRLDEAMACFEKAVAVKPDFTRAYSNLLLCSQYLPGQSPEKLLELHKRWPETLAGKDRPRFLHHEHDNDPKRRLRVAIVSPDLGRHPMGYFMSGFFKHHPKDQMELFCYSDRIADDLTEEIRQHAAIWVESRAMGDDDLAQRIYADKIDILIDLSGHTAKSRLVLFSRKPAPVQISWGGYVSTTGLATMDWLIADRHHIPEDEGKFYVEKIIRLPDSWLAYAPPEHAPDCVSHAEKVKKTAFRLGNFGNPTKINREILKAWADIMAQHPATTLSLIYKGMDNPANIERIIGFFTAAEIDAKRINIQGRLSHKELLAQYNEIDLALDTQPYSGGVTTLEALWMGVPVVTMYGDTFAGRHSASFLRTMELDQLVGDDMADYVRRASALIADPAKLKAVSVDLRRKLRESALCDHDRFAAAVSGELRRVWGIRCAGAAPGEPRLDAAW